MGSESEAVGDTCDLSTNAVARETLGADPNDHAIPGVAVTRRLNADSLLLALVFVGCAGGGGGGGGGGAPLPDTLDIAGCTKPADCDDGNPCTSDVCDPDTHTCEHHGVPGCLTPCDMLHPCDKGACDPLTRTCVSCIVDQHCGLTSVCDDGRCVEAQPCTSDLDCKSIDSVCLPSNGLCVECLSDADCGTGTACKDRHCVAEKACASSKDCPQLCDKAKGVCVECSTHKDCGDGAFCDGEGQCQPVICAAGRCVKGDHFACAPDGSRFLKAALCDDGNPCTNDGCSAAAGCSHEEAIRGDCSDGNACNGLEICGPKGCQPGTEPVCDDGKPCTLDVCKADKGCVNPWLPPSTPCDDGSECTGKEVCDGMGSCKGTTISCDDGNLCTKDVCNPLSGCAHLPTAGACDDEDLCTKDDACKGPDCVGTPKTCDDGQVCTIDTCAPKAGCKHTPSNKACEDDDPCTDDACLVDKGCVHLPAQVTCDDGNVCTVNDVCDGGKCKGADKSCDDGNGCTADVCNAKSGCAHVLAPGGCDDGDKCTAGDTCKAGDDCVPGKPCIPGNCVGVPDSCDDNVPCTLDTCQAGIGCKHSPSDAKCDDNEICTDDSCVAASGCKNEPITASCNDGNACTKGDTCKGGVCAGGPAPDCDDGNLCTTDTCAPASGCVHTNNIATCDDNDACTVYDACAKGTCLGKKKLFNLDHSSLSNNALVAAGDGFAVTGTAGANKIWLRRLSSAGQQVWSKNYSVAQSGAARVVTTSSGFGIATGTVGGVLLSVDASGNKKWALGVPGTASKSVGSGGIVSLPNGLAWLGSGFPNGQVKGVHLVVTNSTGGVATDVVFGGGEAGVGSAIPFDGDLLVGGRTGWSGWVHRVDLKGKLAWSNNYGGWVDGLAAVKDGFLLAGSKTGNVKSVRHVWIARVASDGKGVWSRVYPTPYAGAQAIVALPDGLAAAGWVNGLVPNSNNGDDFWLVRADSTGNLLWKRGYGKVGMQRAGAIVALADGFALAGLSYPKSKGQGWLLRTDAFGNATCAESGSCIIKTATSCNDGNVCTTDQCTGAAGCTHGKAADGVACGSGKKCASGVCGS